MDAAGAAATSGLPVAVSYAVHANDVDKPGAVARCVLRVIADGEIGLTVLTHVVARGQGEGVGEGGGEEDCESEGGEEVGDRWCCGLSKGFAIVG